MGMRIDEVRSLYASLLNVEVSEKAEAAVSSEILENDSTFHHRVMAKGFVPRVIIMLRDKWRMIFQLI